LNGQTARAYWFFFFHLVPEFDGGVGAPVSQPSE
jgi:hypothetical protein